MPRSALPCALSPDRAVTFLPADPPRAGVLAVWDPAPGIRRPGESDPHTRDLSVVLPGPDGAVRPARRAATFVGLAEALPLLLTAPDPSPSTAFWGAAARSSLALAARGLLLPGLSPAEHDAWRLGPLDEGDQQAFRDLAAAMPPHAHAVPLEGHDREQDGLEPRLPHPETLLRSFGDAIADLLPRSSAASLALGGAAFASMAAQRVPGLRGWAEDVATGLDLGARLSLRVEVLEGSPPEERPRFRTVLQLAPAAEPATVRDASSAWALGGGLRTQTLLALRRAAHVWPPLQGLLTAAVPDAMELSEEEAAELLGIRTRSALLAVGVAVHWPAGLHSDVAAHGVMTGPRTEGETGGRSPEGLLSPTSLVDVNWRFTLGGRAVDRTELEALAASGSPLVRLDGAWTLVDPAGLQEASAKADTTVPAVRGLAAALTGSLSSRHGEEEVQADGALGALVARITDARTTVPDPVPAPAALDAELRGYQRHGLDWLHRLTSLGLGACLADDMGLGKTVTLIALHLHRRTEPQLAGPTLVVCPASLLGNWEREIHRFAPGVPVRRYHGGARSLSTLAADEFVLTTYGTMRRDAAALAPGGGTPWGLVVADEAQHVKNPASGTARALRTVPAKARVALTGTPVENDLSELWAVLDWATPGLLGPLGGFRRSRADAVERGDPQAAERLAALIRPFLLRRRKSDPGVAPELPPKTETDHAVGLTGEQAALYAAVVRETMTELSGSSGIARRGLVLRLLTSLKQICNHPAQFLKEEQPLLRGRSGKLDLLDELLDTLLSEDSAVLVFTQYTAMARLVERHLTDRGIVSQLLHGGTPVTRREQMVRRFQDGKVPVFLLSLKAAGTGLNLTRAEHVVHLDRWWNPAVEAQATDRAYRIGQTRPVQVHRIIAEGTVEERIAGLLGRKRALADAVLGTGEAALTELTDAELAALVALTPHGDHTDAEHASTSAPLSEEIR